MIKIFILNNMENLKTFINQSGYMKKVKKILKNKLILLLILAPTLFLPIPLLKADLGKAVIINVQHHTTIYEGDIEILNITVRNKEVQTESANFFLRVYSNKELAFDEFPETWPCSLDGEVTRNIALTNLRGPKLNNIDVELWWDNQTIVKQDTFSFDIKVIKVQIDWIQHTGILHAGTINSSSLNLSTFTTLHFLS